MGGEVDRLALCTTFYPGVERFLGAWYESVRLQTDSAFDLWIGLDELDPRTAMEAIGTDPHATWVQAPPAVTPAQVRQASIEPICRQYPAVVFVDADDILYPSRVEASRKGLECSDAYGAAMDIVGERGEAAGVRFEAPDLPVSEVLPRWNIFGLSNTAYRTGVLSACLPIPSSCILVDWFLATRAWGNNARFFFDREPRMAYRQHGTNTARVLPPFTAEQVLLAARRVTEHYALVLEHGTLPADHHRLVREAAERARGFLGAMRASSERLDLYVQALNKLPAGHIWWSCVAHPDLEETWRN